MADVAVPVPGPAITVVKVPTLQTTQLRVPAAQVVLAGETDSPDFDPVSVYNSARGGPI